MPVKTYDPSQVSVIIGGSIMTSWETVKVGRDNDRWTFSQGTSGETTRTKNASLLGTIILTLPQASSDNATLSAFEVAGTLLPCMVVDKSGSSIATMPEGTVVKVPDLEFGKEAGQCEWSIKGDIIDPFISGGNN